MTDIIGPMKEAGADMVPSPHSNRSGSSSGHRRQSPRSGVTGRIGGTFARGASRIALVRCPRRPETVASYIAECAGRLKVGSVQRRLNAIAEAHKAVGLESPTHHAMVTNTMKGIRRTKGTAPAQKAPTLTDDIRAMVDATDAGIIGTRDRALVLLGFAGAFRRSELVALDVEDCAFGKDGLTVTLRRSKTDQDGAGRKIGIPYGSNPETCPVRTIQTWMERRVSRRAVVPFDQSARPSAGGPFIRHRRCPRGEETGGAGGTGSGEVRGTFPPGRTRHNCRESSRDSPEGTHLLLESITAWGPVAG